ncbi:MAG TPA: peptidyl-prolyl cis-trans isomerase [Spirochaetales bacterium]|nr:peptidyl-prolyl cis-trans isomerase [Spirochaetales bacterium]
MPSTSKKKNDSIKNRSEAQTPKQRTPKALYIFSIIILVIIVVTFVGAPVIGKLEGPGRIIFGYYKDKPIEYVPGNYFSRQRDLLAEQLRSQGDQNSSFDAQVYQVWRGAYDRTVFHTALVKMMEESGFSVSENLVDETLASYPAFMENGEFSVKRYQQTPASERYLIRKSVRESLLFQGYLQDLGTIPISTQEIQFLKNLASPERKFKYIQFPFSEYPESEVQAYGQTNADKFKRARLSIITITTGKKDAEKVFERLQKKELTFEDAARSFSRDTFAEKGGEMGWRYAYELDTLIKNTTDTAKVLSLKKGEIEGPIESSEGWLLFRCEEEALHPDLNDPEVKKTVRSYMMSFERGKIEDYLLTQAKQFKEETASSSFESLARSKGFSIGETDYFPINYGNSVFLKPVSQTNSSLAGAAFRESFFVTAFSLKKDETSDPIVLGDSIVVLKMVEERTVDEKELQMLNIYLPYIIQQFTEENLQQFIFTSKDFKDDFNSVFFKYFINTQE